MYRSLCLLWFLLISVLHLHFSYDEAKVIYKQKKGWKISKTNLAQIIFLKLERGRKQDGIWWNCKAPAEKFAVSPQTCTYTSLGPSDAKSNRCRWLMQ